MNNTRACWVDIGANLGHESFAKDYDAVLERARDAGVAAIVLTGTSVEASGRARELAAGRPQWLSSTAGVHPHEAREFDAAALTALDAIAADEVVRAAGECGLDFHRNYSPRDAQLRAFQAQLEWAADRGLPLFLHCRDAEPEFGDLLERFRHRLTRAVVHCFTGDRRALDRYLELDLHIGITGWVCDERRGQELRSLVESIPAGRLMIETDAPYLLPRSLRPKPKHRRNEPAFLPHIGQTIAQLRGERVAEFAEHTSATAGEFFELPSTDGNESGN